MAFFCLVALVDVATFLACDYDFDLHEWGVGRCLSENEDLFSKCAFERFVGGADWYVGCALHGFRLHSGRGLDAAQIFTISLRV